MVNIKNNDNPTLTERFLRGDVCSDNCPSREILNHVTSRWGVLILVVLQDGKKQRFSELRRAIHGVSEKMLAQTLKHLENDGFILRTSYNVVPPHVEYSLTEIGVSLSKHVVGLADWIESNIVDIMSGRNTHKNEENNKR